MTIKIKFQYLTFIFILFFGSLNAQTVKILLIHDCNLFESEDGRLIRLADIETPSIESENLILRNIAKDILTYADKIIKDEEFFIEYLSDSLSTEVYLFSDESKKISSMVNWKYLIRGFGTYIGGLDSKYFDQLLQAEEKSRLLQSGIWQKSIYKKHTIIELKYGHSSQNLFGDKFDEAQFSTRFNSKGGMFKLSIGNLNNLQEDYGCCECPDPSFDKLHRIEYQMWYARLQAEFKSDYHGFGLGITLWGSDDRWCSSSGHDGLFLPRVWFKIGKMDQYYITIGLIDHFPVTIEGAYFSFGATYAFDDSFSKIAIQRIGFSKTAGIGLESEIRIFYRFFTNAGLQYYFELENYNSEIQKDLTYFKLGVGYILGF